MGASDSKFPSPSRQNSIIKRRDSKINELEIIKNAIFDIRRLVEGSTEIRQQYDSYYEVLTQNSQKVCEMRSNFKQKSSDYKKCTEILKEINECINLLDSKRSTTESNLDVGAAVSTTNSIIAINPPKNFQNDERIKSLSEMEIRMNKIDNDIRKSFELNDHNTLTMLEKKIRLLYKDLDMYNARPFSEEYERKKKMSQRLVKFHNKISSIKRSSKNLSISQEDGAAFSRPSKSSSHEHLRTIMDIEQELNDYEVAVLTFEHTKDDKRYEELNQKLRNTFIRLDNLTLDSKDSKVRVENAKTLTKKILHELNKKGSENEGVIRRNMTEIDTIEIDLGKIRKTVENSQGVIVNDQFKILKHELTSLIEKLEDIKCDVENIKARKDKVNIEINSVLKLLKQKSVPDVEAIIDTTNELKRTWIKFLDVIGESNVRQNRQIFTTLKDISTGLNKLLDYHHEDDIIPKTNIFTEYLKDVQKIEDNVMKINHDIEFFNNTSDSKEYEDYENILLRHKNDLENIPAGRNTINIAKDRVLLKINEAATILRKRAEVLDNNNKEKRHSVFLINKIINSLQHFEVEIESFKGSIDDPKFFELQQTLSDNKDVLESSNDSVFEDVETRKNIIDYINKLKFKLTQKASSNKQIQNEIEDLKSIVRNVRTIKSRIECFNGLYKDDQYIEIENEIHLQLLNLNKLNSDSNKIRKNKMQTQISLQKYFKELEEKSLMAEPNENKQFFDKIDQNLIDIRNQIENFDGVKGDETYYKILGKIFACDEEVSSINEEETQKKLNYQKNLRILKSNLEEITSKPLPLDNSSIINENFTKIQTIESKLNSLEEDIKNFKGKKTDDTYGELDANLVKLMVDLDKIDSIRIPSITQKRRELLISLNKNAALLDAKSREDSLTNEQYLEIKEEINKIAFDVKVLHDGIINFKGTKHDSQHSYLDEALIKLMMKLDKIDPMGDGGLKTLKQETLREIQRNMQILEKRNSGYIQIHTNGLDGLQGTQV